MVPFIIKGAWSAWHTFRRLGPLQWCSHLDCSQCAPWSYRRRTLISQNTVYLQNSLSPKWVKTWDDLIMLSGSYCRSGLHSYFLSSWQRMWMQGRPQSAGNARGCMSVCGFMWRWWWWRTRVGFGGSRQSEVEAHTFWVQIGEEPWQNLICFIFKILRWKQGGMVWNRWEIWLVMSVLYPHEDKG